MGKRKPGGMWDYIRMDNRLDFGGSEPVGIRCSRTEKRKSGGIEYCMVENEKPKGVRRDNVSQVKQSGI